MGEEEKEKTSAWKHEKGLQVWEGQMFFRPAERRKKRAWRVRKINLESEWAWRGERGRKATSTATGRPRIPLCFIPVRKQEESVWPLPEPLWHFTQTERANEPTKTSTPSPLICCLFLLLLSTKGMWRRKGENKKNKKAEINFIFCTRGSDCFYRNRYWKQPRLLNGVLLFWFALMKFLVSTSSPASWF